MSGETEDVAGIKPIRPGRELFVRQLTVGKIQKTPASTPIQLVFQHGLCGTELQFDAVLESLEALLTTTASGNKTNRVYKCLLYDGIGCGQSPPATDYSLKTQVDDLRDMVEHYSDPKLPLVFVTHSYGTSLVLHMLETLESSESLRARLKGVILLGTAVRCEALQHPDGGPPIMKLPLPILRCMQSILTNSFVEMAVHSSHTAVREKVRAGSNENDMGVAQTLYRSMVFASSLQPLVGTPALVVHGSDDGVLPLACGQFLANKLPDSKLVVLDQCSHLLMMEKPQQVAESMVDFLDSLYT